MTHIEIKSSLPEERKQSLLDFLSIKLASLGQEYELATLDRIIITDEFTEDVIRVQKEYHLREFGHTDRKDAIAIAKVLDRVVGDELHQTIVINSNLMAGLFDPEYAQAAYHYFHHEICHVHDNYHQHKMFSRGEKAGSELNKLEDVLVCHANPVWKEYFAVRLSAQTIPVNEANGLPTKDLYVTYLLDQSTIIW